MPYTDEQKAEALAVYEAEGLPAAAKAVGCDKATILRWAEKAGVEPPQRCTEQTKAATAAHVEAMALERRTTRAKLARSTQTLLDRIEDEETPSKCQALAVSAAILVDKWQVIGWGDGEVETEASTPELERLRAEAVARGEHLTAVA